MRTLRRAAVLLAAPWLGALPAFAQAPAPARGTVVERITSLTDPQQSYALYLPKGWEPGRRWPVLVAMDPQGRATLPIERFRAAAEKNGWIVASSYNTVSDTDSAVALNDRAVDAILTDALERYAADSTRVYLAGFSGTARYAWTLPPRLKRVGLAGIIGVGAGLPQPPATLLPELRDRRAFAYFGAAGSTDYNLDELARLDTVLMATGLPHRFTRFEGGHEWLPPELAERAIEWLHLQSIALGTAPRDTAWMASLYTAGLARCQGLEQRGDLYDAWAEYHALVGDFLGLRDVSAAQARYSVLGQDRAVRRDRDRHLADALAYDQFRAVLDAVFSDLSVSTGGMAQRRLVGMLDLDKLQHREADTAASEGERRMASRMLNTAYALGEHEGDVFLQARRYRHAASALRVARQARPEGAGVCWPLARALAQAHDRDAAFEALGCALDRNDVTPAQAEREPMLEPLRADPRFTSMLSRTPPTAARATSQSR